MSLGESPWGANAAPAREDCTTLLSGESAFPDVRGNLRGESRTRPYLSPKGWEPPGRGAHGALGVDCTKPQSSWRMARWGAGVLCPSKAEGKSRPQAARCPHFMLRLMAKPCPQSISPGPRGWPTAPGRGVDPRERCPSHPAGSQQDLSVLLPIARAASPGWAHLHPGHARLGQDHPPAPSSWVWNNGPRSAACFVFLWS